MKKIISVLKNLENKTYFKIWLFFHLAVILFFAINFFIKPSSIGVDADLFNMLPKSSAAKSIQAADEKLTEITGQNVFILVSNKDFAKAKIITQIAKERRFSEEIKEAYNKINTMAEIDFPIKGKDIIDCGLTDYQQVGSILKELEQLWIDSNFDLTKEQLLLEVNNMKNVV